MAYLPSRRHSENGRVVSNVWRVFQRWWVILPTEARSRTPDAVRLCKRCPQQVSWSNGGTAALTKHSATIATIFALVIILGCASSAGNGGGGTSLVRGMTAPNPTGCYVKVFDQPQFRGAADFLNGPMRYSTLARLANGADWANRIRSLEVGPGATATAWADVNYTGTSMELRVDRRYATLPTALVGTIKSLDVRCIQAPASSP